MASASLAHLDDLKDNAIYMRTKRKVHTGLKSALSKVRYSCKTPQRMARGITLEVEYEELFKLLQKQNGKCAISGVVMSGLSGDPYKISIDRKDSTKPYTIKNVQLVTQQVNLGKSDYTDRDFIKMCIEVATKNGYVKK